MSWRRWLVHGTISTFPAPSSWAGPITPTINDTMMREDSLELKVSQTKPTSP